MNNIEQIFQDSESKTRRAKILLYGSYGTGKTILGLQFPNPVMIDLERGSDCYLDKFKFKVFHTTEPDAIIKGVSWLQKNKTDRQSIILDSMTEYWSALQEKWTQIFLRQNKGKGNKGGEFYELQPKDWVQIKNEFKSFLRKLLGLDMNVICTCRVKDQYAEGEFLKKVGETFDSDRSLPYLFDTVVRLDRSQDNRYMARVEKDRTNLLPKNPFEVQYLVFAAAFSLDGWDEIAWPDAWLWANHKGKAITGKDFATDATQATYTKDEKTFSGRQCLHIMTEKHDREEVRMIARKLLEKYPSQKKQTPVAVTEESKQETKVATA